MRWSLRTNRVPALGFFVALSGLVLPSISWTSEPSRAELIRSRVVRGSELILIGPPGDMKRGHLVQLQSDGSALLLRTFEGREGRFRTQPVALMEISELRLVERSRNALYPVLGGIGMGLLGAGIGHALLGGGGDGGDRDYAEIRSAFTLGLGLAGATFGFVGGAMLAPEKRTETILWSDDRFPRTGRSGDSPPDLEMKRP